MSAPAVEASLALPPHSLSPPTPRSRESSAADSSAAFPSRKRQRVSESDEEKAESATAEAAARVAERKHSPISMLYRDVQHSVLQFLMFRELVSSMVSLSKEWKAAVVALPSLGVWIDVILERDEHPALLVVELVL